MDRWGFELNLYNVQEMEALLQAISLQPRSIASDFDFPKGDYRAIAAENERQDDGSRQIIEEMVVSM